MNNNQPNKIDWDEFYKNLKFDTSWLSVDCQSCGHNSKIDDIENICPNCGSEIIIPIIIE